MACPPKLEVSGLSSSRALSNRLTPDLTEIRFAASGMAWKGEDPDGEMVGIASGDIKWVQWLRVARNYQLRVGLKDRSRETFDGFTREVRGKPLPLCLPHAEYHQDHDKVAQLLKQHFSITLETKEVSFKGWNWGVTDFQGESVHHKPCCHI